jgi:hypothetical protein
MTTMGGGEGTRTSAAVTTSGCGAWSRRTFAVGRLTRRGAEIQLARPARRSAPVRTMAPAREQRAAATVH